jgi:uncharacterized protein with GYD domain
MSDIEGKVAREAMSECGQRVSFNISELGDDLTFDAAFAQNRTCINLLGTLQRKERIIMARYVSLIQFADQGIRNIKDTIKRGDAAVAEAEKLGMKIIEEFWTMGAYDQVVLFDAPDDETMTAFACKVSSLGNVKTQTMRAFRKEEMEGILSKIK